MIVPGQAQKEMTHNEALARLDAAVQPCVAAIGTDAPPASPGSGDCWIVGNAPTGEWSGHARNLAIWTDGGWRFVEPHEGFSTWVADQEIEARFIDGTWVVGTIAGTRLVLDGVAMLGAPRPAVSAPSGGTTIDSEARVAIAAVLGVLRHHNLLEAE